MGSSLATLESAASLMEQRRSGFAAAYQGMGTALDRLVATFTEDINGLNENLRPLADRVLDRASNVRAWINGEVLKLNEQNESEAWWLERSRAGAYISNQLELVQEDMIGLVDEGRLPSEDRARREVVKVSVLAALLAGSGYYLWWRKEKAAEAEQTEMLASGEIEDCGCKV